MRSDTSTIVHRPITCTCTGRYKIVVTVRKFEDVRSEKVSLNIVFAGSERVVCEILGDTYAVVGSALPDIDDGVEGKFADTDSAVDGDCVGEFPEIAGVT